MGIKNKMVVRQPIIHDLLVGNIILEKLKTHCAREFFDNQNSLTIATVVAFDGAGKGQGVNNHVLKKSCQYLGLELFNLVSPHPMDTFSFNHKLVELKKFLVAVKTKYFLFCDANDVVIQGPMKKIFDVYTSYRCRVLFQVTKWEDHDSYTMPHAYEWNNKLHKGVYLNSGVYLGETNYIRMLIDKALKYASFLPRTEYQKNYRYKNGYLKEDISNFPQGCGDDQSIFRYLYWKNYPSIKIDYEQKFVYR